MQNAQTSGFLWFHLLKAHRGEIFGLFFKLFLPDLVKYLFFEKPSSEFFSRHLPMPRGI